jgi:hypothetical protein
MAKITAVKKIHYLVTYRLKELFIAALRQGPIRTKTGLGPYLRVSTASVGPVGIHRAVSILGI